MQTPNSDISRVEALPARTRGQRPIARAVLVLAIVAAAARPAAFGEPGHRVVGQLAELHLASSRALQEVRNILEPGETLADAGVWADEVRSPGYGGPDAAAFRLKHPAHEVYHYTNVPYQAARYDRSSPGAHFTDIVRVTQECIRALRGRSDAFTRREALRLLAHLVADIHQPLHVGNGFVPARGALRFVLPDPPIDWHSTAGGNALRYGPKDAYSLHSYWDSHVVNLVLRKAGPREFAAQLGAEAVRDGWRVPGDPETWPERWATESLGPAKDAYGGATLIARIGQEAGSAPRWRIRQAAGYDVMATAHARLQLAKAGFRLAETLRAIWPEAR